MRELLKNAFYGDELSKLNEGTARARDLLVASDSRFAKLGEGDWKEVAAGIHDHFGLRRSGVFGGQITAGDGWFIGAFMAAMRPAAMVEVGVASGYSSALILSLADRLGLLREDRPFLHSFDLMQVHANGGVTGQLLRSDFPQYERHWSLTTEVTTAQMEPGSLRAKLPDGPVMAFLDGGHNHPWPAIDLMFLRQELPNCEWALLQDAQMMERWIADAVVYGTTVPVPVRGVQLAVAHWPGDKLCGLGMCYNMAAAHLDISRGEFSRFVRDMRAYPPECDGRQWAICQDFVARLF